MGEVRIIKKYPNRRLYDTHESNYIKLEDVKKLVLEYIPVKVIDVRTNEDLTDSTLLQIIMEQEETGSPIFTTEILQTIIRFYGHSLQHLMSAYLDHSVQFFVERQSSVSDVFQKVFMGNPLDFMTNVAENNLALWRSLQDKFFETLKRNHSLDDFSTSSSRIDTEINSKK